MAYNPYGIPQDSSRYSSPAQVHYGASIVDLVSSEATTECGQLMLVANQVSRTNSEENAFPVVDIFANRNPSVDPIEGFVRDKLIIIETAIRQVLKEIEQREELLAEILEQIDAQIGLQKEMFWRIAPYDSCFITIGDPRRRVAIERTLATLETERRREQSSAWKDIASLKRELRELIREYNEETRKQRAVGP